MKRTYKLFLNRPGMVAAGPGDYVPEEPPTYVFLRKNTVNARADGIVLVHGDSMEPIYHNGDYVYYEEAETAFPGEDVIVDTDEGDDIIYLDGTNDEGYNVTSGNGNDIIYIKGSDNNAIIDSGAGSDTIFNFGNNNKNIYSGVDTDLIVDSGKNNNFVNSEGNDTLIVDGAKNSTISGVDNYVLQKSSGSFTAIGPARQLNITSEKAHYVINPNTDDAYIEYRQSGYALTLFLNGAEITTTENEISNLNIIGADNLIHLSASDLSGLTVNGNNNTVNSDNGNYEVLVNGIGNTVSFSEGNGYVEVSKASVDNTINGNSAHVIVANMGKNTIINNCNELIKAADDIDIQAGITSEDSSVISLETGLILGQLNFDVTNNEYAKIAVEKSEDLITKVTEEVAKIASQYSRLNCALEQNEIDQYNITSSKSTLKDADIATYSSEYVKNLITQQSSSILSIVAGQMKQENVLRLINSVRI